MSKSNKAKDAVTPVTNLMGAIQDASIKMMPEFGPEWFKSMAGVGAEMLAFMSERVKQDVQTQQDLLRAKGLVEIQKIQADFVTKAMDDYANEMAKLMGMGTAHEKHATPV